MPKLVFISDTHDTEIEVPEGDILIHSGDATYTGSKPEMKRFGKWLASLPHAHKVFVPGNHELSMDVMHSESTQFWRKWIPKDVHVLVSRGVTIMGLRIHGCSFQPKLGRWAFGRDDEDLKVFYSAIDDETDVLVTHCPPLGILDSESGLSHGFPRRFGSVPLRDRVEELLKLGNLKVHAFGHIHESYGQEKIDNTLFINASILDENYKIKNKPITVDL